MYGSIPTSSLNITKIIGGISKSLNIVNQVIPLYKEMKPIITNAGSILSVFKEMNKEDNNLKSSAENNLVDESKIEVKAIKKEESSNTLTFFQ